MEFSPTHAVPRSGTRAWESPDANAEPVTRLPANVQLEIVEWRGAWAQVRGANGWTGWVDGRSLRELAGTSSGGDGFPPGRAVTLANRPVPLIGVGLVLLGSLLPLVSLGGLGVTAWETPFLGLVANSPSAPGLRAGMVLLLVVILLIPYVSGRSLPVAVVVPLAAIASNTAFLTLLRAADEPPSPGLGAYVILVGSFVLMGEEAIYRIRLRIAQGLR